MCTKRFQFPLAFSSPNGGDEDRGGGHVIVGLVWQKWTVPLGGRFCENGLLSISKPREKSNMYGGTERYCCIQISP